VENVRNAWWVLGDLSILVFTLVALSRWKESDHPWHVLGLEIDRIAVMDALAGFLIGAVVMIGIFSVEQTAGLLRVSGLRDLDFFILVGFLWSLPGAFAEELFCRGFMLNGLFMVLHGRQKWLAVAISAIAFGFIHAINPHASDISILGNALGGVVYALAYLRSGRLWLGTGLHFGWNFVQGTILGFPVSGVATPGMVQQTATGDVLLTGGAYGPEAGLVGMGFRFVTIIAIFMWIGWRRARMKESGPLLPMHRY
jgi:membrane protease YdiL (CAAX protease family)